MDSRSLIDEILEVSIVGSFSRVGFQVRRKVFGWGSPSDGSLVGRTALVTGSTSGLGREAAGELAALGARVVLVGRNEAKLATVRDELADEVGEDRCSMVVADMGSLRSVRAAVGQVLAAEERLDIVVDNAGAIYPERIVGPDGIEATLAIMAVAPFVLISGLLPLLERTGDARVISVTSGGMYTQAIDVDDLQWATEDFSGPRAYARVKRVQVALVREWARRLRVAGRGGGLGAGRGGLRINAMHPGWADTPGVETSLPGFHRVMRPLLRTPEQGADTIVWLAAAAAPAASSGELWHDRRVRPTNRVPWTRESAADRTRLWAACEQLTATPG